MSRPLPHILTIGLAVMSAVSAIARPPADLPEVTAQGLFRTAGTLTGGESPLGGYSFTAVPRTTDGSMILWDASIRSASGVTQRIESIPGNSFYLSDRPCLLALARADANSVPARLRIYGIDGSLLHDREIEAPSNPALARDGMSFACRTPEGVLVIDLRDFRARICDDMDLFAVDDGGRIVGVDLESGMLRVDSGAGDARAFRLSGPVRAIAIGDQGATALLLDAADLRAVDLVTGEARTIAVAPASTQYRDLLCAGDRILVGTRRLVEGSAVGGMIVLDPSGREMERRAGPARVVPTMERAHVDRGIPWPIAPDAQHPVGNTYGEYQYYGGSPYPHPGIDVMGSPGQPVFAVRRGVVKAILTTSGQLHWRVAVGDSATAVTTRGYLYAHIDQGTIAVDVGDVITQGQYLGDLVPWPIYDFTHCHFTRIEDSGNTWDGVWLSVHNPHLDLTNQSETEPPAFEPARGSDLLAFCNNQSSTYQSPNQLRGAVDIITHVGDRIVSSWVCAVQELRYTIYPLGMPASPLVDDKLSQRFDMTCDTYAGGQTDAFLISLLYKDDSTCNTQGDYDYREFFHVLTNSDGDGIYEQSDLLEAWDTSTLPDRSYVIKVVAIDARGNSKADSMVVTTANGNPSGVTDGEAAAPRLILDSIAPNPAITGVSVRFHLPSADGVVAAIYDPAGRRVRTLLDGEIPRGVHSLRWDGRDAAGREVAAGTYFVRLDGSSCGSERGRFLLVR